MVCVLSRDRVVDLERGATCCIVRTLILPEAGGTPAATMAVDSEQCYGWLPRPIAAIGTSSGSRSKNLPLPLPPSRPRMRPRIEDHPLPPSPPRASGGGEAVLPPGDELLPRHLRRGAPDLLKERTRQARGLELTRRVRTSDGAMMSTTSRSTVIASAAHTCSNTVPRSSFTVRYTNRKARTSRPR